MVKHLERPCDDGVSFTYLRYGWSPVPQLSQLETWVADESDETEEVHAQYERHEW